MHSYHSKEWNGKEVNQKRRALMEEESKIAKKSAHLLHGNHGLVVPLHWWRREKVPRKIH